MITAELVIYGLLGACAVLYLFILKEKWIAKRDRKKLRAEGDRSYVPNPADRAAVFTVGSPALIFGVQTPLPLSGFPAGKTRLRMRNSEYAVVYVRPPSGGIRKFLVYEQGGKWRCCLQYEQGANIVIKPTGEKE